MSEKEQIRGQTVFKTMGRAPDRGNSLREDSKGKEGLRHDSGSHNSPGQKRRSGRRYFIPDTLKESQHQKGLLQEKEKKS